MQRLGNRKNHFMPASLLDSQLATLEPLGDDEVGMTVNVGGDELEILNAILGQVSLTH
jgi:gluconokinase